MSPNPPGKITDTMTLEELVQTIEREGVELSDMSLDILTLDNSWVSQPHISFKWNRLSNIADFILRSAESQLKDLLASTYLEIRQNCIDNGEKTTEALLSNKVSNAPAVLEAKENVLYLQYISNLLTSTKKAIDDRRRALEGLTSLFTTQYFTSVNDNPVMRELAANEVEKVTTETLTANKRLRRVRDKYKEHA